MSGYVEFTAPIVGYIVIGNLIFGLIADFFYWQNGLAAATITRITAHIVIVTAIHFAA